ncbi:MAG: acyl-CoA dehydrogenase family protein [Ketobacteraceae bacterium]|nr:acyl-CoA dehydrogenase family protein [Ketobacteraceae bacterium]
MDFTFTEDQRLFAETIRDFLHNEVTPDAIRLSWDTPTGRSDELWRKMVELGLTAMMVPEAQGGLGMRELDFALIAQECGRVALPEPLVDTAMIVTPLLKDLADVDPRCVSLLEKIASGETRVAIGHATNELVSDAHIADYLLLTQGEQIHLVNRNEVDLTPQESVDPSRKLFTVSWQPNDETRLINGSNGVKLLAATLNRGAVATAAQLLGLAEQMVAMTVQYTADREQFGKPIGSYQALKHHMANCAVKNEFAKAVLHRAAYTVSEKPVHGDFAVSHAKLATGEAALLAAKNSIQCHGAMGYTWECDLHIWMKRAWALDKFWGHPGFHKYRLHQWLMNPNAKIGADKTFGEQLA